MLNMKRNFSLRSLFLVVLVCNLVLVIFVLPLKLPIEMEIKGSGELKPDSNYFVFDDCFRDKDLLEHVMLTEENVLLDKKNSKASVRMPLFQYAMLKKRSILVEEQVVISFNVF